MDIQEIPQDAESISEDPPIYLNMRAVHMVPGLKQKVGLNIPSNIAGLIKVVFLRPYRSEAKFTFIIIRKCL